MRLTAKERDIVARAGLHAELSLRELARRTGHQLHTVRYALERLRQGSVLRKVLLVDAAMAGFTRFQVLFSLAANKSASKQALAAHFVRSSRVGFIAETAGDYDYEVLLWARGVDEILSILRAATKECGAVFFSKALSIEPAITFFPRKYLAAGKMAPEAISLGATHKVYPLDAADHRLLSAYAANPDILKRDLAAAAGMSTVTLEARLAKMKRAGLLKGMLFSPDFELLGAQNFKLLLYARGLDESLRRGIYRFAEQHPHITNFREGFGDADFELGVEVERYAQFVQLKEQVGERFGEMLTTIRALSRYKILKYQLYPFALGDVLPEG